MPGTFSALDQESSRFTGGESLEEKVRRIQDYQFQLLEQLRYILGNLDFTNFNAAALQSWGSDLTSPIYARISDAEGNLTVLEVTAKGLQTKVSDNQGNISALQQTASALSIRISNVSGDVSTLQQTASSLSTRISNISGDVSTLQQTASSLSTRISNISGDVSTLQQTASSLSTRISNINGDVSALQQTASSLSTRISNVSGEVSSLQQTVNSITLSVTNGEESSTISLRRDGVIVSSQTIQMNGVVYFTDLSSANGWTAIHGGNIITGTIQVDTLYGDQIYIRDDNGDIAAELRTWDSSSASGRNKLDIWARAISIQTYNTTGGGDIYLCSYRGNVTLDAASVTCGGNLYPMAANRYTCGTYGFPWQDIYTTDGGISASDRLEKFDIDYDMSRYTPVFDALRPCSFRRRCGDSYRAHTGLIAQDVARARDAAGLPDTELAAYCQWEGEDGKIGCGLRYEEFIAMLIYEVQEIKRKLGENYR